MKSGGSTLREFLINLPHFHSRVMLIFPNVTPPEFKVSSIEDNSLVIQYFSHRNGLKHFVYGLLLGIGKMFNTELDIQIIRSKDEGSSHDEFLIGWI